jgi:alginate O-acetyltransferase complex protein AlgI
VVAGLLMVAEGALRRSHRLGRGADALFGRLGLGPGAIASIKNNANRVVLWLFLIMLGSLVNAPSWRDAMTMWLQMGRLPVQLASGQIDLTGAGLLQPTLLFAILGIVALEIYQWFDVRRPVFERLADRGRPIAWSFYYALIACIFIFGAFGTAQFIYFRF